MLSDRRKAILAALIREYVENALPVGSRTLTERYGLGVSSATVRNELSVLEDDGYIMQPHTSAGRVPTDRGYRAFVDELLKSDDDKSDTRVSKEMRDLKESARELDELLEKTSAALTRFTNCLSIVFPPSVLSMGIRRIGLVPISNSHTTLVVVDEDGHVFNEAVSHDEADPSVVLKVQETLNRLLSGKTVSDAVALTTAGQSPLEHGSMERLFADVVIECLKRQEQGHAHRIGIGTLFRQPEFSETSQVLPILEVLDDDTVMLRTIGRTADPSLDTTVAIGHELGMEGLTGVSMVATRYGSGSNEGIVCVIGPTRMHYDRVIKVVRSARNELDDLF